jgi:hypothetical protein
MYDTHTFAEWAQMLCLATSGYAVLSVPYFVFVDADLADFDPRPAVRRALASGHQAAVDAGHDLNRAVATGQRAAACALRDAAISLAALLMLCTSSAPEATR